MQLNPVYLYSNKVDVFTNLDSWKTERYRKVYQRNFKVFRGVDNRLDFHVRNSDQKTKDITGYTLVFNLVERETQKLLINRNCTTVSLVNGKVFIVLSEIDLNDLGVGFYNYSLYLVNNQTGAKSPLYADSQFDAVGTLEVSGDIFGEVQPSTVIDTFERIPTSWPNEGNSKSELAYGSPEVSSTSTTTTFAVYTTNYLGTIDIEASLEEGGTPSAGQWATVATVTNPTNLIEYQNVQGRWNWFRIKHTPNENNQGTVDKVIYR
jgi:hypothetical protein